jgi:hypothetical protein
VIIRAIDVPAWVNLTLSPELRAKVSVPGLFGAGVATGGCADASLYSRFVKAGLTQLRCFTQFSAVTPEEPRLRMLQQQPLAAFSTDEARQWLRAVEQAEAEERPSSPNRITAQSGSRANYGFDHTGGG